MKSEKTELENYVDDSLRKVHTQSYLNQLCFNINRWLYIKFWNAQIFLNFYYFNKEGKIINDVAGEGLLGILKPLGLSK